MADVKLYIYKNASQHWGNVISFTDGGSFVYYKETILPPQKTTDSQSGDQTIVSTIVSYTYKLPLVTLSKLDYKKKIYKPCKILADLQVEVGHLMMKTTKVTRTTKVDKNGTEKETTEKKEETDFVEVNNELSQKIASSGNDSYLVNYIKGANVMLQIDGNTVAQNYIVYKVRTLYKKVSDNTSLFLELTIYSADKLMDLDKYSRAYTSKKLYTDILKTESSKYHINDNVDVSQCTTLSTLVANHMQMLKYKADESVKDSSEKASDVTCCDELRIPYIVQYNESFYQFMVRTANRFGEFLYFEDGKLNLGMQPSETNYYDKDSNGKDVDWAESDAVQSRYYDSVLSEGIAVEDLAYSYNDHEELSKDKYYAPSADSRYNIDPVPADEWVTRELHNLFYTTQADLWEEELRTNLAGLVFRALKQTSLFEFFIKLITDAAKKAYDIAAFGNSFNYTMQGDNYDPVKNNTDQVSGDNYNQFATFDGSSHLSTNLQKLGTTEDITNYTNLFYPLIRKKEKEIGEQAVWLDFGNYYKPIKLGDKLRVDKLDYVVISVEGSYEVVEKVDGEGTEQTVEKKVEEHLLVSAIPVVELDSSTAESVEVTELSGGSTWTNTLPVPPALPGVLIRDARPQVAFVTQITDPDSLGRIRVRYPWQHKNDDPTPWIRVTLPLATSGGAVNFSPSIGDEVMVGYEHGNIDHPYAMGYLTAPFVNKEWADSIPFDHWGGQHGIKVKTGHHLTFTDGANGASFLAGLFGPLNMIKSLWPVGTWPLGEVHMADLNGGFELSDRYGFYKISGCTEDRSISIESPMGTVEMSAFQGITISAPNGDINITGKNVTISANNKLNISSGNTLKDMFYYQKEWKDSKKSALGKVALGGIIEGVKSINLVENLYDMGFLRCVLDFFLRPVDGTLQIKSYSFVRIEAGDGTTEYPRKSLRNDSQKSDALLTTFNKAYLTVQVIQQTIPALLDEIKEKYNQVGEKTAAFKKLSNDKGLNRNSTAIGYGDVVKKDALGTVLVDTDFKWDDDATSGNDLKEYTGTFTKKEPERDGESYKSMTDDEFKKEMEKWKVESDAHEMQLAKNNLRALARDYVMKFSNELRTAAKELQDVVKKWTDIKNTNLVLNNISEGDIELNIIIAKIKNTKFINEDGIKSLKDLETPSYDDSIASLEDSVWEKQKKGLTRYVVWQYLQTKTTDISQKGIFPDAKATVNNKDWKKYASSIDVIDLTGIRKHLNRAKKVLTHDLFPLNGLYNGLWEDTHKWKYDFSGKILMSDQENKTVSFDDKLALKSETNREFYEENIKAFKTLLKKM